VPAIHRHCRLINNRIAFEAVLTFIRQIALWRTSTRLAPTDF